MTAMRTDASSPAYGAREEIASSLLHGLGVVLSIAAMAILAAIATASGDVWRIVSVRMVRDA